MLFGNDAFPPHLQMLQMMMGHWAGQTAAAIARFEIPDHLANGPRSSDDLARLCEANPSSFFRLMRAGVSIGLLREVEPGAFATTPVGDTLRKDHPTSVRDLVIAELSPGHWLPWGRLYDAVKEGKSLASTVLGMDTWQYYAANKEEGACFARGMGNLSALVVNEVLPSYDFSRFERIVDVGGSQGVMIAGVLKVATGARGVLFDRPDVIDAGQANVRAHGLGDRLESVAGDFMKEVPAGGDLYILKHILHDWDDEQSTTILKNVHRAAKPGAKVLVVEMTVPEEVTPTPVNLMDLNMLVMVNGRERTEKEFAALLTGAGLRFERAHPSMGLFSLIEATRF